jgi:anthranilate synthase component 2
MHRCCLLLLRVTALHLFRSPFQAARYHSLVISQDACPEDLEITAWTEDGTIMAVQHKK